MAYKLQREKDAVLQIDVGGEVIDVSIGGMGAFRRYSNAQNRFSDVSKKMDNLTKNGVPLTEEFITLMGDTVILLFNTVFGEKTTDKIIEFYESNYDEMLLQVYPWIVKEWLPAVKQRAKKESERKAGIETL